MRSRFRSKKLAMMGRRDQTIRIMRIISRMNIGGPAVHVTNLSVGLDSTRYSSLLVSGVETSREGSLVHHAVDRGVRVVIIPDIQSEATLRPRDFMALIKLWRLMRQERPHIVHTHTVKQDC